MTHLLVMNNPVLSRCAILDIVLRELGFSSPIYADVSDNGGLSASEIHFVRNTSPDEPNSDDVHTVMGSWVSTVEEARESAASRALLYLLSKEKYQIRDYSYGVLTRLQQHNRYLLSQCEGMAAAINTMLVSWLSMNNDVLSAVQRYRSQVLLHSAHIATPSDEPGNNTVLNQIKELCQSLMQLHSENLIDARKLHRSIDTLVERFSQPHGRTRPIKRDQPMGKIIPISYTMMLDTVLTAQHVSTAIYEHSTHSNGEALSCCIFYPAPNTQDDGDPDVIYSSPSVDFQTADQDSALKSLEYMDAHFHVQLVDYNYETKESEADTNRSLMGNTRTLASHLFDVYHGWRKEIDKICLVPQTLQRIITCLGLLYLEQPDCDAMLLLSQSTRRILSELHQIHAKAAETHETFTPLPITLAP